MIDHDNIATLVRQSEVLQLIEGDTYLDLYDEVQRLRTEKRLILDERDKTFALMLARAKAAMDADRTERDALSTARSRLNQASDDLHLAYFVSKNRALWLDYAIRNMRNAADTLGYDLVKRDD